MYEITYFHIIAVQYGYDQLRKVVLNNKINSNPNNMITNIFEHPWHGHSEIDPIPLVKAD